MKSKYDGLGLHHLSIERLVLCGGFPDFGRGAGRTGIAMSMDDKKGRSRLKYIIYDTSLVDTGGGRFMTKEETERSHVGYCVLLRHSDTGVITGLIDIVIKPAHRGCGIGSTIVDELVKEAQPADFDVYDVKQRSRGFWTRMGAVPVDARKKDWVIRAIAR